MPGKIETTIAESRELSVHFGLREGARRRDRKTALGYNIQARMSQIDHLADWCEVYHLSNDWWVEFEPTPPTGGRLSVLVPLVYGLKGQAPPLAVGCTALGCDPKSLWAMGSVAAVGLAVSDLPDLGQTRGLLQLQLCRLQLRYHAVSELA